MNKVDKRPKYIFRWKYSDRTVDRSWAYSEEEVWKWAIKWLRPSKTKDDKAAEKFIREYGEVVVIQPLS